MRILSIFLTLMVLIAGVLSCADPTADEPGRYNLTVSSSDGGSVISPGEDTFAYEEGAVVDLVATADDGYRFVNWAGDVYTIADVEAASTTITMNGDYEITANFERVHELTISSSEGGSVTTPGEGVLTYEAGTVVSLVASPASGYRFVNWTGHVDTIADVEASSTTITLDGDYSITANFVAQYVLTIGSTEGGEVAAPGEGAFTYDAGTVVELVAEAYEGYKFMEWTGDMNYVTDVTAASSTVTMNSGCTITARFAKEIRNWHDLDAIRNNLNGRYVLMNDLDSATAGYAELASPTANGGRGWAPIGYGYWNAGEVPDGQGQWVGDIFGGTFDGQDYSIAGLFIDRPDEDVVGLFGCVDKAGLIEHIALVNTNVTGHTSVGGLVGWNDGTLSNSYASGSVSGRAYVGGLVGHLWCGTMSNCHYSGSVTGRSSVGGLVGFIDWANVSNCYYNHDEVLINGKNIITVGALFGEDFEEWLANDKSLDINERLAQQDGYYLIEDAGDLKELLAFGQDASLRFRLEDHLDLATEANFYIPYLAGEFAGNRHTIYNLSFNSAVVSQVGLFGYIRPAARVTQVSVENAHVIGDSSVGALVGWNNGSVSKSYAIGSVTGNGHVGGLVGMNHGGAVNGCYFRGGVIGRQGVGGAVGRNDGTVSNSYAGGSVIGEQHAGGLVGYQWYDTIVSNSYSTSTVTGSARVGGLIGLNLGSVSNCFWDTGTSGIQWSDGGTGKTTAEMKSIATFTDTTTEGLAEPWDMIAVSPSETNRAYTWNIIDGETYPFLSWQSVT